MKRLVPAFFLFSSLASAASPSQKKYDFNPHCQQAYTALIQLKLRKGQQLLDAEKKDNPDNLIPYFLENYIDFFILFFNEDPAEYRTRKEHIDKRLQLMGQGPESSPFYLFTSSMIHFQWAAVKIKFGNHWDAAGEFRRSFLQNKENWRRFAGFYPNVMLRGAMEVTAGTIPGGYQWLSNLLGIKGNIHDGMQELQQFIARPDSLSALFRDEAIFYYLYLKFYIENKREEVFRFIAENKLDLENNQLFTYLAVNLAVNGQQSAYAKKVLLKKNNSEDYFDSPIWDMEMGYIELNHLEPDAGHYLEKFIAEFKGKFYVKDVLQKLSWFYYLADSIPKARAYRIAVLEKGNLATEADKQAMRESQKANWPNKQLLRARLLNDGGYHEQALQVLLGKNSADFATQEDKTEFAYRLGRIYDDLGRKDEAIAAYLTTVKLGEGQKQYFAARAALQIGYIYEDRKNLPYAISYFKKCLSMKDHEYKNSLDQKAMAGIARCEGK